MPAFRTASVILLALAAIALVAPGAALAAAKKPVKAPAKAAVPAAVNTLARRQLNGDAEGLPKVLPAKIFKAVTVTPDYDEFGNNPPIMSLDADGNTISTPAVNTRYGWLGGKQRAGDDQAGLIVMGVRLYDPKLGRFLAASGHCLLAHQLARDHQMLGEPPRLIILDREVARPLIEQDRHPEFERHGEQQDREDAADQPQRQVGQARQRRSTATLSI